MSWVLARSLSLLTDNLIQHLKTRRRAQGGLWFWQWSCPICAKRVRRRARTKLTYSTLCHLCPRWFEKLGYPMMCFGWLTREDTRVVVQLQGMHTKSVTGAGWEHALGKTTTFQNQNIYVLRQNGFGFRFFLKNSHFLQQKKFDNQLKIWPKYWNSTALI